MLSRRRFLKSAGLGAAAFLAGCRAAPSRAADAAGRPNILLIMSDDMGFSDLGCYGSEIATPTLDGLASRGVRFTQFYNTARCCPTRASLISGLYQHQAGIGHMMGDRGIDGFRGDLSTHCVTIAEALKPAGYGTYMTGKWHVTPYRGPDTPKHNWPCQRGFDRYFGTIHGAGSFYDPNGLTRDNEFIPPGSDDFYYTDAISASAATYIRDHRRTKGDAPFFMYVAYTAAHWPMHARPEDIAKYKGRYDAGWQAVRQARYARMKKMGLIKDEWDLSPRDAGDWNALSDADKAWHARRMEVYAAMVTVMDEGIDRIVQALKETGAYENTLILFLQDNGGCAEEFGSRGEPRNHAKNVKAEPMKPGELQTQMVPPVTRDGRPTRVGHGVMPGPADTYIAYGLEWANVSNTPFRLYKHWVHEGGISTPLIAHWPAGIPEGRRGAYERQPGHLIDIMATCVDLAGAAYPKTFNGHAIVPMQGVSLAPAFLGKDVGRTEPIYFEHEGNRAIRIGKWKLVAKGPTGPWELYDIDADRSELHDLAGRHPDRVKAMAERWETFARQAHMIPWPWKGEYGKAAARKASRKTHFELGAGAALAEGEAPDVAGKAFRVAADAQVRGDGVIAAQGGSSLGWSLYVQKGRLCFATRHRNRLTVAKTDKAVAPGRVRVTAALARDGRIRLEAGGRTVAQAKAPGPLPSLPVDGLEVGRDEKGAVGEYEAPNALAGTVETVVIDVEK